ncbi:MAG: hypothetical protein Q8830_03440 [Candidatus Phytoplasma australasiaticum]|nr:hypothetical protein [Candidatus Phytoplasma australasiaticum]
MPRAWRTVTGDVLKRYHQEYVNNGYHPKPVKRIFIPKDNKKTRPLGLPTI